MVRMTCKLPTFNVQHSKKCSRIFSDTCRAHFQMIYGLYEDYIDTCPTTFLMKYTNKVNPKGYRGPCLRAVCNYKTDNICDNIAFNKDEPVIFSNTYAVEQIERYEAREINLLNPNAICINKPFTSAVRKIIIDNNVYDASSELNSKHYFEEFRLKSEIEVALSIVFTHASNFFEPFVANVKNIPNDSIKDNEYLKSLWFDRHEVHSLANAHRVDLQNQYFSLYNDEAQVELYTGFFYVLLNGLDLPIGPDFSVTNQISVGGCPIIDRSKQQTNFHPYRYSTNVPNIKFDDHKGWIATRDIYDREVLTVEPSEKKYLQESCFAYTRYLMQLSESKEDNLSMPLKRAAECDTMQLFKRRQLHFNSIRGT